jgi:broad specificity phosphatase PhoE
MNKILICTMALLAIFIAPASMAFESTYYVVRHAEKMAEDGPQSDDPMLTAKGLRRAAHIAGMLKDANIKAVYSTDTKRTLMTATVTAADKGIAVELFSTDDLPSFADMLKSKEGTFLIVAHSSSTPDLAALLSGVQIPKLDEEDFEKLFKVVIVGGKATLEVMTTTFE